MVCRHPVLLRVPSHDDATGPFCSAMIRHRCCRVTRPRGLAVGRFPRSDKPQIYFAEPSTGPALLSFPIGNYSASQLPIGRSRTRSHGHWSHSQKP
ncbi:hypothetical protein BV22DRAFT_809141 [Leucogyrophana mollusca]|uniref:Uncharacterized protein n=1 Tax=Leucogyrophana mollusca TaxID=85980 RepID=A0ACB8B5J0_9AGAM|nr:hypothetical protein BV22DRAFT_809141 [Leucogyrophana mollusca]